MIDADTERRLQAHLRDLRRYVSTPSLTEERTRDGYIAEPWRTTLTAVDRYASMLLDTVADQWISVKDRLPEPGVEVLVLAHGGYMEVKHYVPNDGVHAWGWYPGGLPIVNSTHWTPLPPKPKDSK